MVKQWPHTWQPPMRKPWRVEKYPPRLFQGSEWDEASRDIWDKYSRNKQKQTSYEKKVNICRMLSSVLEPVHPGYMFLVTGSTLNGFGTERSDLDICLLVDDSNATSRDEALAHLKRIKQTLENDPSMTKRAELILAKVPILKFRDARWDVEVDINCNSNVAIRNTHLLYCYSICDWRVRPLVTIVKLWAARHRINDAKNMTISSYSLVLMVIHFLQCGVSPPVLPCLGELYPDMFSWQRHVLEIDVHQPPPEYFQSMNNQPLGKLLLDFFQYYLQFDYSRFALSVRLGTKIPIEECQLAQEVNNGVRQKPLLCIEEPFERTNTAYAVHNHEVFGRITAVFRNSYSELKKTKHLSSIFKRVPQLTY
ncbi:Poly(A) RNA polymerase gld-2 homolog A [Gryllus bimaculatus]|nr:Poly(A) RNA polymerase gld-2 homolog A [Gryllus bimaculatus]